MLYNIYIYIYIFKYIDIYINIYIYSIYIYIYIYIYIILCGDSPLLFNRLFELTLHSPATVSSPRYFNVGTCTKRFGTKCISPNRSGDKMYRRQNVSVTNRLGDKTYQRQNVSADKTCWDITCRD